MAAALNAHTATRLHRSHQHAPRGYWCALAYDDNGCVRCGRCKEVWKVRAVCDAIIVTAAMVAMVAMIIIAPLLGSVIACRSAHHPRSGKFFIEGTERELVLHW
ncbi:MAG: hypothetical protein ABW202_09795 [Duganella sp.]